MCFAGQSPAEPASAADAVAMARAGLSWLATADTASLTTAEQADCLRALEGAVSMHTAARARVLRAFSALRSGRSSDRSDRHGVDVYAGRLSDRPRDAVSDLIGRQDRPLGRATVNVPERSLHAAG